MFKVDKGNIYILNFFHLNGLILFLWEFGIRDFFNWEDKLIFLGRGSSVIQFTSIISPLKVTV